jgi:hypothetical protein
VSFCAACDKLYLDPDAVRQRLRAICQQPQCPPAHARE